MANLTTLNVQVTANAAPFADTMKGVGDAAAKAARDADTTVSSVSSRLSGIAGTAGRVMGVVGGEIGRTVNGQTQSLGSMVGNVTSFLSLIPGPAGAAFGAVGGLFSGIVGLIDSLKDESKAAAKEIFGSILDGSKTVQEALAAARQKGLQTAFERIQEDFTSIANMDMSRANATQQAEIIERRLNEARRVENALQRLLNRPELRSLIERGNIDRARENVSRQIRDTQDRAFVTNAGPSDVEQAQARAVRDLARRNSILDSDAAAILQDRLRILRADMRDLATAQAGQQAGQLARELRTQADSFGMTEREARRFAMAQELATRAGISLAEAQRRLRPAMQNVAGAQMVNLFDRIAQDAVNANRDAGIGMLVDRFGFFLDPLQQQVHNLRLQLRDADEELSRADVNLNAADRRRIEAARDRIRMNIEALNNAREARREIEFTQQAILAARQTALSVRNPLEVYNDQLASLDNQLARGRLRWNDYTRAVGAAADNLIQAAQIEYRAPEAALEGSSRAVSILNRFREQGRETPAQRLERAVDEIRRQQAARTARAEELTRAVLAGRIFARARPF